VKPGDTIGIAAPASPVARDLFDAGVRVLTDWGFDLRISPTLFAREGYFAGSDEARAQSLTDLILDPEVKAVICARGGFGSPRVLPLLDFERIGRHPKPIIGFSDITALLCAISQKCGWVTFHGPMVATLGRTDAKGRTALFSTLVSGVPPDIHPAAGVCLRPGTAGGRLIGGNLATLCHLLGTPYEPVWKGRVLFVEDQGEPLYRIDRMLTHLKLAGCLDQLAGLVVGDFVGVEDMADVWRIVMSVVRATPYPVAAGFPIGHGAANHTMPLGMAVRLDAASPSLVFLPDEG
jgi:muramoyltetrapeptide carboxypeptidase